MSVYENARGQLFVVFRCVAFGSVGVSPAACVECNPLAFNPGQTEQWCNLQD